MASTACGTPGYVAPEILMSQPYGKPCDYWSIGVVAFILLSGSAPFYEEDNFALFESIKTCRYEFEADLWDKVSKEAKDFVSRVMVADTTKRLTCEQMLAHPWMKLALDKENKLVNAKKNLLKYVSVRKDKSQKFKSQQPSTDQAEEDF